MSGVIVSNIAYIEALEAESDGLKRRIAELEAGTALTQAQTDILTKGMREATQFGRAAAFEEAGRYMHGSFIHEIWGPACQQFRALANTSPTMVVVEREILEAIRVFICTVEMRISVDLERATFKGRLLALLTKALETK